jgi:oligopeptide/dipeptide ABC transporter ATP-binding protein
MQAQILDLLADLKQKLGLTYIFISHDLAVVEAISDRVAVLYFGRLAEMGPARAVFAAPQHPYSRLLMSSALVPGRRPATAREESAELPDPHAPPPGCAFAARCPRAAERCLREDPVPQHHGGAAGHQSACHFPHV